MYDRYVVSVKDAAALKLWKSALGGDIKDKLQKWKQQSQYSPPTPHSSPNTNKLHSKQSARTAWNSAE